MTLNSRFFAIIAFLMFEEKCIPSLLLGGARVFPYTIQSPVYELTRSIVSATITLLSPSVSISGYVFSTKTLQTVNEKSSCQQ